jgi:hypothetical protein
MLNEVAGCYSTLGLLSVGGIILKGNRLAIPATKVAKNFPFMHLSALLTLQQTLGSVHFLESQLFRICSRPA